MVKRSQPGREGLSRGIAGAGRKPTVWVGIPVNIFAGLRGFAASTQPWTVSGLSLSPLSLQRSADFLFAYLKCVGS